MSFMAPFPGQGVVDIQFQDTVAEAVVASTHTFTGRNFGAAVTGRTMVVFVEGHTGTTVNSMTIGGVSATQQLTATDGLSSRAVYTANDVPGTSGDVVVTFGTSVTQVGIQIYSMTGHLSNTPTDTLSDTGAAPTGTIDIPVGGGAIGGCKMNAGADSDSTWLGLTEDSTQQEAGTSNIFFSSAHLNSSAGVTGLTVTCSWSVSTAQGGFLVAAWGP